MPFDFLFDYLSENQIVLLVLLIIGIYIVYEKEKTDVSVRRSKNNNIVFLRIIGWFFILFSIIGIIIYPLLNKYYSFNQKSGEKTSKSINIPEQPSYSAALFIKESFDNINNAGNKLDVVDMMQKTFSENLPRNADFWWSVIVEYEIFGCSENIIDVNLRYFNRSDTFRNNEPNTSFSRYTLAQKDNHWIIDDSVEINGSSCPLVFSDFSKE